MEQTNEFTIQISKDLLENFGFWAYKSYYKILFYLTCNLNNVKLLNNEDSLKNNYGRF